MQSGTSSTPLGLGTFSQADGSNPFGALVRGEKLLPLTAIAPPGFLSSPGPAAVLDFIRRWNEGLALLLELQEADWLTVPEASWQPLKGLRCLAPLQGNVSVYCSASNYRKQLIELMIQRGGDPELDELHPARRRPVARRMVEQRAARGEPYFFLRPGISLTGPDDDILLPEGETQLDWELELGVVIGREARHIARNDAWRHVAGYVMLNDITDRSLIYRKDFPGADWLRGKGAPRTMPMGPLIVPHPWVRDPAQLQLSLRVNDELMQDELASDMIIDIPGLISYLSTRTQLMPGDVIATGTPAGTGAERGRFLQRGDLIVSRITSLGSQHNRIV